MNRDEKCRLSANDPDLGSGAVARQRTCQADGSSDNFAMVGR